MSSQSNFEDSYGSINFLSNNRTRKRILKENNWKRRVVSIWEKRIYELRLDGFPEWNNPNLEKINFRNQFWNYIQGIKSYWVAHEDLSKCGLSKKTSFVLNDNTKKTECHSIKSLAPSVKDILQRNHT